MSRSFKAPLALTAILAIASFACNPSTATKAQNEEPPAPSALVQEEETEKPNAFGLVPMPGVNAPEITKATKVLMQTDAGDMTIEVYPEAAPNAAKRFLELVDKKFYDNTPIFRVVREPKPFVAQFGINWRPGMKEYKEKCFDDDPSLFRLLPGTLAFAKAGPNTNSTQVFINYGDNSQLRAEGFTTFARITDGFEAAQTFKAVGDPAMGLDQGLLWEDGENYLANQNENHKPNMIIKMEIMKDTPSKPAQNAEQPAEQPAK
ncbi:peptidylprolyl isomerase [bacterium]|nr:peptidylprolyl isomerase [bacterium]